VTLAEWLDTRAPAQDPSLARRIRELASAAKPDESIADGCLRAAAQALARLVDGDASSRASALDLLAVDALVTYAFEAAAETPDRLAALADGAMHRLSLVAADT
jgi:hypothetical protein